MEFDINIVLVLIAALAAWGLGALWYSPLLFGKQWMAEMGFTPESMHGMKMTPKLAMALGFLGAVLTAGVLSCFIAVWEALEGTSGLILNLQLGFIVWLGFVMPVNAGVVLWEGKSVKLFALVTGYHLVSLLLMGALLSLY